MIHYFRVFGEVRGQGRPRVDYNRRRLYKDKKDIKAERRIKEEYINSGGYYFGKKPLMMVVISHRVLPKTRPKKIQSEPDIYKPDSSNILKCVEDALNKIAYDDDKQIVLSAALKANRERGINDYIEVYISDELDFEVIAEKAKELF